ncbi:hypothetical protein ACTWQF_00090 [Streptomyces sp. 8N114]|uniref:hypothetical protein n=1 Tax=Streptomyces sp. 8N114 TaxID=3457419 RepID=UPI003FD032C7
MLESHPIVGAQLFRLADGLFVFGIFLRGFVAALGVGVVTLLRRVTIFVLVPLGHRVLDHGQADAGPLEMRTDHARVLTELDGVLPKIIGPGVERRLLRFTLPVGIGLFEVGLQFPLGILDGAGSVPEGFSDVLQVLGNAGVDEVLQLVEAVLFEIGRRARCGIP